MHRNASGYKNKLALTIDTIYYKVSESYIIQVNRKGLLIKDENCFLDDSKSLLN